MHRLVCIMMSTVDFPLVKKIVKNLVVTQVMEFQNCVIGKEQLALASGTPCKMARQIYEAASVQLEDIVSPHTTGLGKSFLRTLF